DSYRHAMKRLDRVTTHNRFLGMLCRSTRLVEGREYQRVQAGVARFDALDEDLQHLARRDFLAPNCRRDVGGRRVSAILIHQIPLACRELEEGGRAYPEKCGSGSPRVSVSTANSAPDKGACAN